MLRRDVRHHWEQAKADFRRGVRGLGIYLVRVRMRTGWRRHQFGDEMRLGAAACWQELRDQLERIKEWAWRVRRG